jgi:hypothetical protein
VEAIKNKKVREQDVIQQAAKLEIANLQAQEDVKKAEARNQSATQDAEAIRKMGDAQAYANKQVRASLNELLVKNNFITEWGKGGAKVPLVAGDSGIVPFMDMSKLAGMRK